MNNMLLKLISHHGELSISNKFYDIYYSLLKKRAEEINNFDLLDENYFKFHRNQTLEYLRALCHIDFSIPENKIVILKPTLHEIKKVARLHTFYISGSIDDELKNELDIFVQENRDIKYEKRINNRNDNLVLIPDSIYLLTHDFDKIIDFCKSDERFNFSFQTGSNMIQNSPRLDIYLKYLNKKGVSWQPFKDLKGYSKYYFDKNNFKYLIKKQVARTMLVKYQNPINFQNYFFLVENNQMIEVDYYWGKYLYLNKIGVTSSVIYYNTYKKELKIPQSLKLPPSIKIGLTMLSAEIPKISLINNIRYEVYYNVLEPMAYEICIRLGQRLSRK